MTDIIAIVDYGLGNLFSVRQAFEKTGIEATITSDVSRIAGASGILLPGVGAFGHAMTALRQTGLADAIISAAGRGVPVLGICLGAQLLLSKSYEFGVHEGLGLIPGEVRPLAPRELHGRTIKIPHVSWEPIGPSGDGREWDSTILEKVDPGSYMYFVHSFVMVPESTGHELASSAYEGEIFTAAVQSENVTGLQFHPEKSGSVGLAVYRAFGRLANGN